MAQKKELQKPKFVKVKDLQTHRSGFNVYVKVSSADHKVIDTKEGLKIPMVDCIVADQTGSAKAFFKGDAAKLIQNGNVIAIRNGLKRFIKDKISLEVDLFGRVTLEKDVAVNATQAQNLNISNVEHKLENNRRPRGPPRRREDRRYDNRRGNNFRNNRDERFDRRREEPRRNYDRDYDRNDRNQRRNNRNYDREDRRDNRNYDRDERRNRNYDREDRRDRNNDRDYDRRGNRNYDREDRSRRDNNRPPRREFAEKRQDRGNREPKKFAKLAEITPADQGLNLIVKVLSLVVVNGKYPKYRCQIADNSGVANAFLPSKIDVKEGESLALFNAKAEVVNEHIEIQLDFNGGRMEYAKRPVERISQEFNLSAKSWVPIQ